MKERKKKDKTSLFEGAKKCTDEEAIRILRDTWTKEIQRHVNIGNYIGNDESFIVEHYQWQRDFIVAVSDGKVIISSGWTYPCRKDSVRTPMIYLVGEIPPEIVLKIVKEYCLGIS